MFLKIHIYIIQFHKHYNIFYVFQRKPVNTIRALLLNRNCITTFQQRKIWETKPKNFIIAKEKRQKCFINKNITWQSLKIIYFITIRKIYQKIIQSTIMVIVFWNLLILYYNLFSPQVKQSVIISTKHSI